MGTEDGRALSDVVSDDRDSTPEEDVASGELGAVVQRELASFAETLLDDRERTIWAERLVAHEPVSLAELGRRFGVSKERVRQVEARIKRRLRVHLEEQLGDEVSFEFNVQDG